MIDPFKRTDLLPASGRLLIAQPYLPDPNFARTVVLLCEHSDLGTVGFALNRPSQHPLSALLPEWDVPPLQVYEGGPVQTDTLHLLHRHQRILGGQEICPGIYWGGNPDALQDFVENHPYDESELRLYVGYAGWSPGQLADELEQHSWIVAEPTVDLLFDTPAPNLWRKAIESLGRDFAFLAQLPTDPQLN